MTALTSADAGRGDEKDHHISIAVSAWASSLFDVRIKPCIAENTAHDLATLCLAPEQVKAIVGSEREQEGRLENKSPRRGGGFKVYPEGLSYEATLHY